ncbi:hypothetical protein [Bradyrhizobium sp. 170]|uniref:hypothetical protein n=1 Tax=Bradyrhizobium sp. 170 TaxID=2782641 RepID=UPI001FFFA3DF|nr:hypothetical protein [Bradyrhizobium sp. 170]UPK05424.1 hypothetical protein IVB05_06905 [Bradyrhizobium sp. 170]
MTQLAIGRLSLEIAAAGVRDPAALRDRIADAARRDLKRGLALAPGMEGHEAVHIRRLEVDLTAIGDIPPERIGLELGRRIGVAIDALVRTPDERTIVFESRAARLAAYLAALIEGAPVDRWWFAPFENLSVLARSRAIATVLERDIEEAHAALRCLAEPVRLRLPHVLGVAEAQRLLGTIASPADTAAEAALLQLAALPHIARDEPALVALTLMMEACGRDLDMPLGAVATAANLVAGALATAKTRNAQRTRRPKASVAAEAIVAAPLPQAARALYTRLGVAGREAVAKLVGADAVAPTSPRRKQDGSHFTPFANLALLWPFVDELPLDRMHRGAAPKGADPDQLLTLLLLATVAGPDGAAQIWRDPVWQMLFDLPSGLTLGQVKRALRKAPPPLRIRSRQIWRRARATETAWLIGGAAALVGPDLAQRLVRPALLALRAFAGRLPGFDGSSAPFLWSNLLRAEGSVRIAGKRIEIELARPPLDILLAITRIGDREIWLRDDRQLVLRRGSVE